MFTISAWRAASYAAVAVVVTTSLQLGSTAAAERASSPKRPAAATCLHAAAPLGPLTPLCDDRTPPNTRITRVRPRPDHGWLRTGQVQYEFRSVVSDGDTDPMAFECRFDGPSQG